MKVEENETEKNDKIRTFSFRLLETHWRLARIRSTPPFVFDT